MNRPATTADELVVVAPEYGDHRAAATSRYRAFATAAQRAGWRVRVINPLGLREMDDAALPLDKPRANQRGLLRRALSEVWRGVVMAFQVPPGAIAVVSLPEIFAGLVAGTLLRLRGRRYWIDIRDIYPDVFVTSGVAGARSPLVRAVGAWLQWLYAGAERISTATKDLQDRARARTPSRVPVLLARNGFAPHFTPGPAPNLAEPLFVTHGTLGRFQNSALFAELVVLARREEPQWRFLVIGDGPSAEALAAAAGDNFAWRRSAAQAEMPGLLAPAAVGLSLRTNDDISAGAIPVRMLEYIGLGVPVLVHPVSEGGYELEREGLGRVVPEADAHAVLDALRAMVTPEAQAAFRTRMAQARTRYEASAQWEPVVRRQA
jgi:glycosyltransferase involved in cell wall biosynthesis